MLAFWTLGELGGLTLYIFPFIIPFAHLICLTINYPNVIQSPRRVGWWEQRKLPYTKFILMYIKSNYLFIGDGKFLSQQILNPWESLPGQIMGLGTFKLAINGTYLLPPCPSHAAASHPLTFALLHHGNSEDYLQSVKVHRGTSSKGGCWHIRTNSPTHPKFQMPKGSFHTNN